jgi:hypothetical protein
MDRTEMIVTRGQFFVFDEIVRSPGSLWTEAHMAQGFIRRESTVSFLTLIEGGIADVGWMIGPFVNNKAYDRAIAIPFRVVTGRVVIEGVEELHPARVCELKPGYYRVTAAQLLLAEEDSEIIDLFFEELAVPIQQSSVLVGDEALKPEAPLLETGDPAEVG